MSSATVPLLRAAVCESLIDATYQMGAPIERHARASRLSLGMLEDPTALVPQIPTWRFIDSVVRAEGDALFGLRMNRALAVNKIKTITPFLLNSANCLDLLKRFCSSISLQTNVANFSIEEASEWIWVVTKQREPNFASDQVELFQLAGIISTLQSVLGADWRPEIIDFRFVRPSIELVRSPDLNPCRHRFGQPRAGIAIKPAVLSRPLPAGGCFADSTVSTSDVSNLPSSLIEQVSTAMVAMLGNRVPTAACIEDVTELSLRSLQRKLSQEGTSFRKLLERARLQKAQGLLTCSDLPVQEISAMLGYANPSALSRSFKRWCGVAPGEYRRVWSR